MAKVTKKKTAEQAAEVALPIGVTREVILARIERYENDRRLTIERAQQLNGAISELRVLLNLIEQESS